MEANEKKYQTDVVKLNMPETEAGPTDEKEVFNVPITYEVKKRLQLIEIQSMILI